ncbi:hypothetical protein IscW_ISCW008083 [Ixodes scapularis]|uniref:Uncharacterized protein n=1 Tax=Ixodes scapularis TaxID=6945 RepID=B7PU56_IXOSC|nr:hypothetical protein IscW_ISCW008083 [Ixodes scapularis]|eukprot:XP_002405551.1 hypothetical protein IscW_ISCW008083 [Ixodes scapularis]
MSESRPALFFRASSAATCLTRSQSVSTGGMVGCVCRGVSGARSLGPAGKAVGTCSPHTCAETGVAGQRATPVTSDEDSC